MRTVAGMTTFPESCLTDPSTFRVETKNLPFGVVRRVKESEATDGAHVRI